jgi:hypothetical protein
MFITAEGDTRLTSLDYPGRQLLGTYLALKNRDRPTPNHFVFYEQMNEVHGDVRIVVKIQLRRCAAGRPFLSFVLL